MGKEQKKLFISFAFGRVWPIELINVAIVGTSALVFAVVDLPERIAKLLLTFPQTKNGKWTCNSIKSPVMNNRPQNVVKGGCCSILKVILSVISMLL